jgi:hypothetical protein
VLILSAALCLAALAALLALSLRRPT